MTQQVPTRSTGTTPTTKDFVDSLLEQMTLAEKIGQMTQVEKNSITPSEVTAHSIGSVLSGGGGNPPENNPAAWAKMVRSFQEAALESRLKIPLLYGVDAVHGHNNVKGAVIFPHNVGLGATRNPELIRQVARVTAAELLATNVHWNFAPCVAVVQDIRWGRTYESYGAETDLVSELGVAFMQGMQEPDGQAHRPVLASVKHFVADGGTTWGSFARAEWERAERAEIEGIYFIDQGHADVDEATLRAIHLPPYIAALEAGARNIMVSFSSWDGTKMHAHRYLLTDVLKGELGFDGFLVSDWQAINQLRPDYYSCVATSLNAGMDMVMVPFEYERFIETAIRAVETGDIPIERIDDAVRRILRVKAEFGLFEAPYGDETLLDQVGSAEHRDVAREAVRQSAVLLKNDGDTLPLPKGLPRMLVAGPAADDIGLQCGGWTIEWLGKAGAITEGTTLVQALDLSTDTEIIYRADGQFEDDVRAPIGIVVYSEPPYAEGMGDAPDLTLPDHVGAMIEAMRPRCDRLVFILYSGRPLIVTDVLDQVDAFVAAWLPGTEGLGLTDVLLGDYAFTGKLSFPWPRSMAQIPNAALAEDADGPLWPYGAGLTTRAASH